MERVGQQLSGRRILVVEDEYFVADDLAQQLEAAGAEIIGPAPTLERGRELLDAEQPDAAVLDINLRGQTVYPLADDLRRRRVPFVFATGYDARVIPDDYAAVPRCEKPVSREAVVNALRDLPIAT